MISFEFRCVRNAPDEASWLWYPASYSLVLAIMKGVFPLVYKNTIYRALELSLLAPSFIINNLLMVRDYEIMSNIFYIFFNVVNRVVLIAQ